MGRTPPRTPGACPHRPGCSVAGSDDRAWQCWPGKLRVTSASNLVGPRPQSISISRSTHSTCGSASRKAKEYEGSAWISPSVGHDSTTVMAAVEDALTIARCAEAGEAGVVGCRLQWVTALSPQPCGAKLLRETQARAGTGRRNTAPDRRRARQQDPLPDCRGDDEAGQPQTCSSWGLAPPILTWPASQSSRASSSSPNSPDGTFRHRRDVLHHRLRRGAQARSLSRLVAAPTGDGDPVIVIRGG